MHLLQKHVYYPSMLCCHRGLTSYFSDRNVECVYQGQDSSRRRYTPEYVTPLIPQCLVRMRLDDHFLDTSGVWRNR